MRGVVAIVALALVASACTSAGETTTTTSPAPMVTASSPSGSLIDAALGTQAVQDFIIHLDLAVEGEDGFESIYAKVIERAASGTAGFYDLSNGLTFSPVETIAGHVVGPDGEDIPNLSIDFGLLGQTEQAFEATRSELMSSAAEAGIPDLSELLAGIEAGQGGLLVEIITADLTKGHTHLSPGDRSGFDIEFVGTVAVGDRLRSATLFGQTLPGDPSDEAGLDPHQLFAYRWSNGLISVLGSGGPEVIIDDSLTARQGSVLVSREAKEQLLSQVGDKARQATNDDISDFLEGVQTNVRIFEDESGQWKALACVARAESRGGPTTCTVEVDILPMIYLLGFSSELAACLEAASYLNRRNEQGGIDASKINWAELYIQPPPGLQRGQEDSSEATSTTTPGSATTKPEPPGPVGCGPPPPHPPKAGTTFGDVHVATFDGLGYDNHAVGEFLVFDNGRLVVQMRLEPVDLAQGASIVTAVALRTGAHTVSLHPIGQTWIDGVGATLERGESFDLGDAEIVRSPGRWTVATADGTLIEVSDNVAETTDSLVLMIRPSDVPSIGMFGSPDGNPNNDLVSRDGVQLAPETSWDFENFYPTYIDSWRVSQDESLFHYESGQSTESFLIEGWPYTWMTVAGFSESERLGAEEVCRTIGVTRPGLLPACIFDVALTGDPGFAYQSFMVQAGTPEPEIVDSEPEPVAGETGLSIGSFTMELGAGSTDSWQCEVSEGRFWARNGVTEGADLYELTVEYLDETNSPTGKERMTITVFQNGAPYAWLVTSTDTPGGSIDSLSFDGSTVTATGMAFLNEPLDPSINLLAPIPQSDLQPFTLEASCEQ